MFFCSIRINSTALLLLLLFSFSLFAQEGFVLPEEVKKDKVKFQLVNNLIIIPVTVNGVSLSFVLDSGANTTVIFGNKENDTLALKNLSKIMLKGLGADAPIEAIKSIHNTLQIGKTISHDHTVYLIDDDAIDFSSRMGIPIHGVIGYDFFKSFILGIQYSSKTLRIHAPEHFTYKKCKSCYETPLIFKDGNKPYLTTRYTGVEGDVDLVLLLDSGLSASLWLFENEREHHTSKVQVPESFFSDFLGKGYGGDIYGKRAKIKALYLGETKMESVTTSFPDSIYIREFANIDRDGILGGGVLKRFDLIVDYFNKKIRFKKNNLFKSPFCYNMSGITLEHSGERMAKEYYIDESKSSFSVSNSDAGVVVNSKQDYSIRYKLLPKYEIMDLRPNSPAKLVGLEKGDIILAINGKKTEEYSLSEINSIFYSKAGKKIRMIVERSGVSLKFTFYLKKMI